MDGLNDIFVQNTSGIPYVGRCYGGKFCQKHPEHALVTGFFAAINSFKGEMGQKELNNVIYDQINLIFETGEDGLLVVMNVDKGVDEASCRKIADEIKSKFVDDYGKADSLRGSENFNPFIEWLDKKMGTAHGDLKPMILSRTRSFFGKIKAIFS